MEGIGYGIFIVHKKINKCLKIVWKELDILIKQYNKILKMK